MIENIEFMAKRQPHYMNNTNFEFKNLSVLVTGAASGIGQATAQLFLQHGAKVSAADLNWQADSIQLLSGASIIKADVSIERDCYMIVEETISKNGIPDVIVNCAGITRRLSVVDTTPDIWDKIIDINLKSIYLISRAAIPEMKKNGGGSIVNVASGWGLVGGSKAAAYCASKGGVVLLTKAMAIDHGVDNIRVNCVCPGDTDTPMLKQEAVELGLSKDALLIEASSRPIGRAGFPSEIAEAILFLSGKNAAFITGTSLVVDGGGLAGSA